jgi:hypothetical protein
MAGAERASTTSPIMNASARDRFDIIITGSSPNALIDASGVAGPLWSPFRE